MRKNSINLKKIVRPFGISGFYAPSYKELTLDVREWTCDNCNTTHDRDRNAANNILSFGLRNSSVERTLEYAEQPSLDGALKRKKRLSSVI